MKSLATEAASGQQTANNLASLNGEFLKLQSEIDQIANSTTYNGTNILNGSASGTGGYPNFATFQNLMNLVGTLDVNNSSNASNANAQLYLFYSSNYSALDPNVQLDIQDMAGAASAITLGQNVAQNQTYWTNCVNDLTSLYNAAVQANSGQTSSSGYLVTFQVGATNAAANQIYISFNNATTACLNVASTSVGIGSLVSAQAAMTAIDSALTSINAFMGSIGAYQNQLQYTASNLTTSIQNYTSSESTIMDVDMAAEVSTLTKDQILQQAGTAMLAQANSQPQQILKLLS